MSFVYNLFDDKMQCNRNKNAIRWNIVWKCINSSKKNTIIVYTKWKFPKQKMQFHVGKKTAQRLKKVYFTVVGLQLKKVKFLIAPFDTMTIRDFSIRYSMTSQNRFCWRNILNKPNRCRSGRPDYVRSKFFMQTLDFFHQFTVCEFICQKKENTNREVLTWMKKKKFNLWNIKREFNMKKLQQQQHLCPSLCN